MDTDEAEYVMKLQRVVLMICLCTLAPAALFAQAARDARLQVTVVDETRGVLPGATVTLAGIDTSNKAALIPPQLTGPQGQVTFGNLTPGRYAIEAEFSGFQKRTLPDVRIRSGENRHVLMLPLDRVTSSVTVERDRQAAASDRDVTFGTVMTREQIDALSDDPDEMRRQLMDFAGPDAKILIDSFEGRDLPPKALIKSIRVTRDQFAPEVHYFGELRIEILTQPGVGPIRGNVRSGFYDSATDGENPLVNKTGPAQMWQYGIGLNGTLISERASFNINFNGSDSYSTPVLYAATPVGQVAGNIPVKSPADNYFYSGGVDYALTRDQVLRLNLQGSKFNRGAAGIGGYDLPERAYSAEDSQFGVFLQQNGPLGRRFVLNTRLSIFGSDSVSRSAVEEPTDHRQRRVHERRRAAARRHPRTQLLVQLGSRLRARHPLDAHRDRGAGQRLRHRRRQQLPRHLCLREPRRHSTRARPAATRAGWAIRGSATTTCRAASTSRTTSRSGRTSR